MTKKVFGAVEYVEMLADIAVCDDVESDIEEHPEEVCGAYKSDWLVSDAGDICVRYCLAVVGRTPYHRNGDILTHEQYSDYIKGMECIR